MYKNTNLHLYRSDSDMGDMMYRLVLRAQFENAEELNRVTQGLEGLKVQGANVNVSMGRMGETASSSLQGIARSAMSVGFMFNMMESAMMRSQMATLLTSNAQDRLNTAVARYGKDSEPARKAAKELGMQMDYLNMANSRAYVSMGIMTLSLVAQSEILKEATIATIAHTATTIASTAAHWAKSAALGVEAVLLGMVRALEKDWVAITAALAVGVAIGGTVGAYMATRPTQTVSSTVNINTDLKIETDLDKALEKQNREVTNAYKSMRP
jgi:hypothetical protein